MPTNRFFDFINLKRKTENMEPICVQNNKRKLSLIIMWNNYFQNVLQLKQHNPKSRLEAGFYLEKQSLREAQKHPVVRLSILVKEEVGWCNPMVLCSKSTFLLEDVLRWVPFFFSSAYSRVKVDKHLIQVSPILRQLHESFFYSISMGWY